MTRQLIGSIPLHSRVQLLVGEDERVWEYIDDCPVELRSLCGIRGQNEGYGQLDRGKDARDMAEQLQIRWFRILVVLSFFG